MLRFTLIFFLITTILLSFKSHATTVKMTTNFGDIDVILFDKSTPETEENFLKYIEDNENQNNYKNVIFHRNIEGFIIQAGLIKVREDEQGLAQPERLSTLSPAPANEPFFSNGRGTIALAKTANNFNSGTSQFFFNINNNDGSTESANLDEQNGGFTVFGQVIASSLPILDDLNSTPTYIVDDFIDLPLRDIEDTTAPLIVNNFLKIETITVIDSNPDTEDAVEKTPNTKITPQIRLEAITPVVNEVNIDDSASRGGIYVQLNQRTDDDLVLDIAYSGTADESDFTQVNSVILPAGQYETRFDIDIINDDKNEDNETILISVTSASNEAVNLDLGKTSVTILGDETSSSNGGGFFSLLLVLFLSFIGLRRFRYYA